MLVSTLVPTIINFSIALISIGTLEPQNQKINNWKEKLRQSIELREIKTSKHEQRKISEYILIHRLIIPILLVSLLLIGAIYLLGNILQELEITQQYISNLASHFAQFVQGLLIE